MSILVPDETNAEVDVLPRIDLSDPTLYINRELSWIEFNGRCRPGRSRRCTAPAAERVKFLAIFSSNLDEFFMIRVSGLKDQIAAGVTNTPPDGMTPTQQFAAIREKLLPLVDEQRRIYQEDLLPELAAAGVEILDYADLDETSRDWLRDYFNAQIFPVLTPLAFDPGRPFPHISNLSLNLAVSVCDPKDERRFARLKVPTSLPRLVALEERHVMSGWKT